MALLSMRTRTPALDGGLVRQRGASLLFALLTLGAMSLAAVALVRSVDTASLLAGNLGFKQASIAITGRAAEAAVGGLVALRSASKLGGEEPGEGYYPIVYENLDPTNKRTTEATRAVVDWDNDGCAYAGGVFAKCLESKATDEIFGNKPRYVVMRMCTTTGASNASGNACAKPITSVLNEGPGRGAFGYPSGRNPALVDPGPYYRIVVRTVGARNTITYAETIVHF